LRSTSITSHFCPTMKFSAVILALALAVTTGERQFKPIVTASVGHDKIGSGITADGLNAEVQIETEVSDELTVGLEYDHGNSDNPIKSVFAKISQAMGGGNVDADLSLAMGGEGSISGDVTYKNKDIEATASVNSGSSNIVEKVELVQSQVMNGLKYVFRPTFNVADSSMDLEASADINDKTNVFVKFSQGSDNADVEISHALDSDTDVKVEVNSKSLTTPSVEVSHRLDDDNTVKPKFDMSSNHLTCAWVRKLDAGRTATVTVNPENSVDMELESDDDDDWTAKVSAPWGSFADADVTVGRKFNF